MIVAGLKRISNILKYGLGPEARERKSADKTRVREARFHESETWRRDEGMARREYASYEDYLAHQASKLDTIVHRLQEKEGEDFAEFKRRFETCGALAEARSVLCLGARLGTEVMALHALGYFAVGIDLNPGPENPYVLTGDFHGIVFPDESVDAIYTNALDHVYSLDKIVREIHRLLRPNGVFVADLELGFEEGFVPGEYESTHWASCETIVEEIREKGSFGLEGVRDLGQTRRDIWVQAVFRKRA